MDHKPERYAASMDSAEHLYRPTDLLWPLQTERTPWRRRNGQQGYSRLITCGDTVYVTKSDVAFVEPGKVRLLYISYSPSSGHAKVYLEQQHVSYDRCV